MVGVLIGDLVGDLVVDLVVSWVEEFKKLANIDFYSIQSTRTLTVRRTVYVPYDMQCTLYVVQCML